MNTLFRNFLSAWNLPLEESVKGTDLWTLHWEILFQQIGSFLYFLCPRHRIYSVWREEKKAKLFPPVIINVVVPEKMIWRYESSFWTLPSISISASLSYFSSSVLCSPATIRAISKIILVLKWHIESSSNWNSPCAAELNCSTKSNKVEITLPDVFAFAK